MMAWFSTALSQVLSFREVIPQVKAVAVRATRLKMRPSGVITRRAVWQWPTLAQIRTAVNSSFAQQTTLQNYKSRTNCFDVLSCAWIWLLRFKGLATLG